MIKDTVTILGGNKQMREFMKGIGALTKNNNFRIPKANKEEAYILMDKFVNRYKNSSVRGIERIKKETIENFRTRFKPSSKSPDLTYKEAEAIYEFYGNFENVVDKFGASEQALEFVRQASIDNLNQRDFLERFSKEVVEVPDVELRKQLRSIWRKFIKKNGEYYGVLDEI